MKISLVQILLIYLAIMTWTSAFAEEYLAMEPSTVALSEFKDFVIIGGREYVSYIDSENNPHRYDLKGYSQRILVRATNPSNNLVFFECGSKVNFYNRTNRLENCQQFGKSSGYSSENIVKQLGRQQLVNPLIVDSVYLAANAATSGVRSGSISYFVGGDTLLRSSKTVVLDSPLSQTRDNLKEFLSGLTE